MEDPDRCAAADVPADVAFATKPALATRMITATLDAAVPACWVVGDKGLWRRPGPAQHSGSRGVGYVLAEVSNWRIPVGKDWRRVDEPTADLPAVLAATVRRGRRARLTGVLLAVLDDPGPVGSSVGPDARNHFTGELAYYLTYSPHRVPPRTLVRVAGQRWRFEESFQTGKGLTGLDDHQVRRWGSWHRWVTLVMLAHAFLTVITAAERATIPTSAGLGRVLRIMKVRLG